MKEINIKEAYALGISTKHHEMDNGEKRFRLVSTEGSSYILTKSTENNNWQNSHVHYLKKEFYIVEKGVIYIALWDGNEVEIITLNENDSFFVPAGVAHNVLMSENAIVHTVKYGSIEEDWNCCKELDEILSTYDMDLLKSKERINV